MKFIYQNNVNQLQTYIVFRMIFLEVYLLKKEFNHHFYEIIYLHFASFLINFVAFCIGDTTSVIFVWLTNEPKIPWNICRISITIYERMIDQIYYYKEKKQLTECKRRSIDHLRSIQMRWMKKIPCEVAIYASR